MIRQYVQVKSGHSMGNDHFAFRVIYDGPALERGDIDARILAPALLGLTELVRVGNQIVSPGQDEVTVKVQSEFRKGSFDIGFELARAHDRFVGLFSGTSVQAWATLLSLIGISGIGLLQLLKSLRGKKARRLSIERSEKVTIEVEEGTIQDIPEELWRLLNNRDVRQAVEDVISPLKVDGVESFRIERDDQKTIEVSKEEVPFFESAVDSQEPEVHENPNAILKVVSPSFNDGNKWRVSDGTRQIWAGIIDEGFIKRINDGEAFRKGDILRVTLRTTQVVNGADLSTSYDIVRVHSHVNTLDQSPKSIDDNA